MDVQREADRHRRGKLVPLWTELAGPLGVHISTRTVHTFPSKLGGIEVIFAQLVEYALILIRQRGWGGLESIVDMLGVGLGLVGPFPHDKKMLFKTATGNRHPVW